MFKFFANILLEYVSGKKLNWRNDYFCPKKEFRETIERARWQANHELSEAGYTEKIGHGVRKIVFKKGEINRAFGWLAKSEQVPGNYTSGEYIRKTREILVVVSPKNTLNYSVIVHTWKHAILNYWGYIGETTAQEHKWMQACPKFSV